jgi:hypothetical protein
MISRRLRCSLVSLVASTTVFLVDLAIGTATAKATVDLYVTGAGVSTCAPLEPPK